MLAVLLPSPPFRSAAAAPVKEEVRRILIFDETTAYSPLSNLVDRGIKASLNNSPYRVELYREFMETASFPDPADQQVFRDFYTRKYQSRKPDVIIAVGPAPLQFMIETHKKFFPGVPVIFCLPNRVPGGFTVDSDFTGVEGDIAPAGTLAAALRLRPGTKHVVVVSGTSPFDRQQNAAVKDQLKTYEGRLDISYLTDLTMPDVIERLKHLPNETIVILSAFGRDAAGDRFTSDQAAPLIVAAANAPVFSLNDRNLNHGEVGGDVSNALEQSTIAGRMALQMLNGEKPQDVPTVKDATTYVFDWRALQRWGMKESNLPPGSTLLNKQPTVWALYKWYLVGGVSLILVQTLLILGLLWQRSRRRTAEANLSITFDRLRMAVEAGKCVGWDWDAKTGENRWFGDLQTMFGIRSDAFTGKAEDFRRHVHSEDRERVLKAIADAKKTGGPYVAEFRVIRDDQTVRWITAKGKFYYWPNGEAMRMLGIAVDITDRKLAEEVVTSLSGKLIEAQDEERKRIAREIHDDYQQRLALVAIDLEELEESGGISSQDAQDLLHDLWNRVSELGADLHTLSRSLHSTALEHLGLAAGLRAWCKEFSDQQDVQVEVVCEYVPRNLSPDVTLCLFRIAQEGMRNVKRHSGASRAEIRLNGISGGVHLSVSDRGKGFDPKNHFSQAGIGLRSMQERLRLVGGRLEIQSRRGEGTRIDAWIPVKIEAKLAG